MKKILISVSMVLMLAFSVLANDSDQFNYEDFKAKKIAYITAEIDLTPAEAEKFWPVYNEFEQKKFTLMQGLKELDKQMDEKLENLSDQEYIELSKKITSFHINEGNLDTEYNVKFLKILPPKKVVKLYVAEKGFRNYLLHEYRKCDNNGKRNDK
jgi:hypothetical protein